MINEEYIISSLKRNDKSTFDFIFGYYYPGLCAYANSILNDKDCAEDIVQDVFVNLWLKSSKVEITKSLKSYMFVSVKNQCLDFLKHQKISNNYKEKKLKEYTEEQAINFNHYIFSELKEVIENSLKKLPPRCQEIYSLSRYDGKTNQEIADQLGISRNTVNVQISNALKHLRKELEYTLPIWLVSLIIG